MIQEIRDYTVEIDSSNLTFEGKAGSPEQKGDSVITIEYDPDQVNTDSSGQVTGKGIIIDESSTSIVSYQGSLIEVKSTSIKQNNNKGTIELSVGFSAKSDNPSTVSENGEVSGEIKEESGKLTISFNYGELYAEPQEFPYHFSYSLNVSVKQQAGEAPVESGPEPQSPGSNADAEKGEFSQDAQKKITEGIKPNTGDKIKIPEWVVYNLIANSQGYYQFQVEALKGLVDAPIELATKVSKFLLQQANVQSLWDGSNAGEGTLLGNCKSIYDKMENAKENISDPEQYIIRLESPTEVTKFGLKSDGTVGTWKYTTRVLYGQPKEGLAYLIRNRFIQSFNELMTTTLDLLTYTNTYQSSDKLGKFLQEFLTNILKQQGSDWVLYLKEPWMQFIYDNLDFYTSTISNLKQINIELEKNTKLEQVSETTKPTPENVMNRSSMRLYQQQIIEAKDSFGITPFTLMKSEIYKQEYYNTQYGIDIVTKFGQFMVEAEAIISKVPKDIQDTINSVLEPMGAIVATPVGPGAVPTNAVQIAGQLKRTKDALHKLKIEIQKPIDLAKSIGIPEQYYSPLTVIAKMLSPF